MKKLSALLLIVAFAHAVTLQEMVRHYNNHNYRYVCLHGYKLFRYIKKDENLLSMYAFACLKSDYIDRLAVPILLLHGSKTARKNRAYFSLILAQKNLLVSSLCDGEKLTNLRVPNTDFYLSEIFNLYYQKKYKIVDNSYIFKDKNVTYRLKVVDGCRLWIEEKGKNFHKVHSIR